MGRKATVKKDKNTPAPSLPRPVVSLGPDYSIDFVRGPQKTSSPQRDQAKKADLDNLLNKGQEYNELKQIKFDTYVAQITTIFDQINGLFSPEMLASTFYDIDQFPTEPFDLKNYIMNILEKEESPKPFSANNQTVIIKKATTSAAVPIHSVSHAASSSKDRSDEHSSIVSRKPRQGEIVMSERGTKLWVSDTTSFKEDYPSLVVPLSNGDVINLSVGGQPPALEDLKERWGPDLKSKIAAAANFFLKILDSKDTD